MEKTYWTLFYLSIFGTVFCVVFLAFLLTLFIKSIIEKPKFVIYSALLMIGLLLSVGQLVPCIKDFCFLKNNTAIEENATVIEFTKATKNPDGNGRLSYSKPKFYLADKKQYIVLYMKNVEIGKEYRIKYYPNTRIGEVLYCIE